MRRRAVPVLAWETALAKNPADMDALVGLGLSQFTELAQLLGRSRRQRVSKHMFADVNGLLMKAYSGDKARSVADRKRVRTALGMLNGFVGRFEAAEKMLNEAIAVKPAAREDARAYLGLGEVYLMQNKEREARAAFKKITSGYPDSEEAQLVERYLEILN
jgi:tetratricopeptide (TPR) repeat protein